MIKKWLVGVILLYGQMLLAQAFTNIAALRGVDVIYNNQSFGGGVSLCDFNGDGLDDLTLATANGDLLHLFQNSGAGFTNIVQNSGITSNGPAKTVLWWDYDNDSDQDLFVAYMGFSNRLYRNEGNMSFVDVTASSGIGNAAQFTIAACVGDYNNDGWLDLYVTNRVSTTRNYLYKNNGNGTFSDVTLAAGVGDESRFPLAVAFLDINNDGWQDIYIANDRMGGNTLFANNGDGTFRDISATSGAGLAMDAMGIAIGDYDNDLDLDMYISNTESGNALLRNNGDETFTNVADSLGIAVNKVCWGVNFIDYDNDSDLDLYVSVNHPDPNIVDVSNSFFENLGNGTFANTFALRSDLGFQSDTSFSWGSAVGDINQDGFPDLADLNSVPTRTALWENPGGDHNWLKVRLEGRNSNCDGVGSILRIYRQDNVIMRSTHCGISYLSQNSATEIIGLANAPQVDSLVVNWPSGQRDTHYNLGPGQTITLIEGVQITGLAATTPLPENLDLIGNYPNPFNPTTTIRYRLAAPSGVRITIFNLQGQAIRSLFAGNQQPGVKTMEWDGRDAGGEAAGSGVYIYRIQAAGASLSGKMILVK